MTDADQHSNRDSHMETSCWSSGAVTRGHELIGLTYPRLEALFLWTKARRHFHLWCLKLQVNGQMLRTLQLAVHVNVPLANQPYIRQICIGTHGMSTRTVIFSLRLDKDNHRRFPAGHLSFGRSTSCIASNGDCCRTLAQNRLWLHCCLNQLPGAGLQSGEHWPDAMQRQDKHYPKLRSSEA